MVDSVIITVIVITMFSPFAIIFSKIFFYIKSLVQTKKEKEGKTEEERSSNSAKIAVSNEAFVVLRTN